MNKIGRHPISVMFRSIIPDRTRTSVKCEKLLKAWGNEIAETSRLLTVGMKFCLPPTSDQDHAFLSGV